MKLFIEVTGAHSAARAYEVEVEATEDGRYRVRVGGDERTVEALEVSRHATALIVDGAPRLHRFDEAHGQLTASDGWDSFRVRVTDERAHAAEALLGRRGVPSGAQEVRSIMPGIVTRVLVAEGATVEAGAALLIIEAMKMENEVRAEIGGVIRKLCCRQGITVNAGDLLLEIEPPAA
jgi:biotin carboxyl carrier protein